MIIRSLTLDVGFNSPSHTSRQATMKPALNPQQRSGSRKAKRPPEQTFEEPKYLRRLIENATPVRIKLTNNEEVAGIVEFYDVNFIRITRARRAQSVHLQARHQVFVRRSPN